MRLPRRAHGIVRCETPPRCCYLRRGRATRHRHQLRRCSATATVTIVDGDPREATYACDEHRGVFAGEAWPVGCG